MGRDARPDARRHAQSDAGRGAPGAGGAAASDISAFLPTSTPLRLDFAITTPAMTSSGLSTPKSLHPLYRNLAVRGHGVSPPADEKKSASGVAPALDAVVVHGATARRHEARCEVKGKSCEEEL